VLFLIAGASKAEVIRKVLKPGSPQEFPVQRVWLNAGRLVWMLDEAAARLL
jgi:6-phosphogluconolactonase/glucosamine-6-phosphate isomerase/deaminase